MKVSLVFTACLALAVAHTDLWLSDDADIANVPHVHWIPTGKDVGFWADHSAIPVKVAQSLFRTYGLDQPSDVDIDNFADDVDYNDEDALDKLRSLYYEPVLIFLEDADKNVVAYYADRGINTIRAYPETYNILKKLLGTSNAVVFTYKPEKFLHPADMDAVSSKFFVPRNFRIAPLVSFARTYDNFRVDESPLVFRKSEISSYSPADRTAYAEFDIDKIPYGYRYPITLKATETFDYPVPYHANSKETDFDRNAYRYKHYPLEANTLKYYCNKYPHMCTKYARFNNLYDEIPITAFKSYPDVSPVDNINTPIFKAPNVKRILGSDDTLNLCIRYPSLCGTYSQKAPYLKSLKTPYWDSLSHIPYVADTLHGKVLPFHDTNINYPYGKMIVPKYNNKFSAPVVNPPEYSEDYNPVAIHPVTSGHDHILRALLGSQ